MSSAAATRSNGALLLQAAREKRIELFTSTGMLAEFIDILGRRKFARKIAASQLIIDQLVEGYAQLASVEGGGNAAHRARSG